MSWSKNRFFCTPISRTCIAVPIVPKLHAAPFPKAVRQGGLVGPRLTGLIGYLKGGDHLSYTTLQALVEEGLGMPLSTGMLAKVVDKVSQALAPIYQPLVEVLPD